MKYRFMGCCRFQRHLVKVEDETGGGLWGRDGSSAGNSRLKRSSWLTERGVAVEQAARDLDVHETRLRAWMRELTADSQQAFPGKGVMKPEQAGIERLRKEVAKLKMERVILKKAAAFFAKESM